MKMELIVLFVAIWIISSLIKGIPKQKHKRQLKCINRQQQKQALFKRQQKELEDKQIEELKEQARKAKEEQKEQGKTEKEAIEREKKQKQLEKLQFVAMQAKSDIDHYTVLLMDLNEQFDRATDFANIYHAAGDIEREDRAIKRLNTIRTQKHNTEKRLAKAQYTLKTATKAIAGAN